MKNSEHREWLILVTLAFLIVIMSALQGCQTVNLAKKSDATCAACYGYLVGNCAEIAKKDSVVKEYLITQLGVNIHDTLYLPTICDSLKRGLIPSEGKVITTKKKGNLSMNAKVLPNGKLVLDCVSDTVVIKRTIAVGCECIFTDKDLANYAKAKVANFWHKFRWWIIGIAVGIIALLIIIKQIRK